MSDMKNEVDQIVGKTVERVEVHRSSMDNWESSFTMYFTDGTEMYVGSQSFNDGSSVVTVDVS